MVIANSLLIPKFLSALRTILYVAISLPLTSLLMTFDEKIKDVDLISASILALSKILSIPASQFFVNCSYFLLLPKTLPDALQALSVVSITICLLLFLPSAAWLPTCRI